MKKKTLFLIAINFSFFAHAQFGPQQLISEIGGAIFPGDIDSDGDIDIIAATSFDDTIAWYENLDGQGNFGPLQVISTNADYAMSVSSSDIDGDGDLDVISGSREDHKLAWYKNIDGQGTFGSQLIISTSVTSVYSIQSTDIDGDGDLDIIVADFGNNMVAWYENIDGQGNFNSKIISPLEITPYAVYPADLDGDGDMDVLCAAWQGNRITWFENLDGDGNFGPARVISINANAGQSVFAEDIDADGDMDVLFTSLVDDKVAWHKNLDGLGNFGAEQIITLNANGATCVYAADLDNNGSIDALSTSEDGKIAWYKNTDGLGIFGPQEIISTQTNLPNSIFATDIDGDGDNDVVANGGNIAWYGNLHPLSINENQIVGVSVYPNPVKYNLYIDFQNNTAIKSILVFDVSGKKLIEINGETTQLNLNHLPNGIYLLEVKTGKGVFTEKIIKE